MAIILSGMLLGWKRWRDRNKPVFDSLPHVDGRLFGWLVATTTLVMIACGPIAMALGFGYWLVDPLWNWFWAVAWRC
jgi:hypothetical protein